MGLERGTKTEHTGHKGSGRKSGFWGRRVEAKKTARKFRRLLDKTLVKSEN